MNARISQQGARDVTKDTITRNCTVTLLNWASTLEILKFVVSLPDRADYLYGKN